MLTGMDRKANFLLRSYFGVAEMLTRMSSKGQIVIPQAIRSARAWKPGLEFEVEDTPQGLLLRPVPAFPETRIEDVIGCVGYAGAKRSLVDMRNAVPPGYADDP